MKQYITQEQYNVLRWEQKLKIQKLFKINPSAQREMVNNEVKFDGVVAYDLEVINIGNMIEALGDTWDSYIKSYKVDNLCDQLWDAIIEITSEEVNTTKDVKIPEEPLPESVELVKTNESKK